MNSVVVDNPGYFVLPDEKIPIFRLKVHRNPQNQIQELIIYFDPSSKVREKLKSHKPGLLQFRGTEEQIEIDVPVEFCGWHEDDVKQGYQHLHQTKFDQNQIQKLERFLETIVSRQRRTSQ